MKRLVAILVMLVGCGSGSGPKTAFNGPQALAYVDTQVAFGPRIPNTPAHEKCGDWILAHLRATADSVDVQAFDHVTVHGDTLHLRNFIAHFLPKRTDRVLYLAHWDTRPHSDNPSFHGDTNTPVPGANDGASGVAVLLGVANVLHETPPSVGVDLLFEDGEDYGDFGPPEHDVLIGTHYFVDHLPKSYQPLYAVLFDMVGDKNLDIYQEGNSLAGAPEVVDRVWSAAQQLGYEKYFIPEMKYSMTDDHIPLLQHGIHTVDVIDFDYGPNNAYWHTPQDTPDKVSAHSLQVVGDVAVDLVQ